MSRKNSPLSKEECLTLVHLLTSLVGNTSVPMDVRIAAAEVRREVCADASFDSAMSRPEYMTGDVVQVYNPQTDSYQWIEVEEVREIHGARVLVADGSYYCACLVNVEAVAMPEHVAQASA